MDDIDCFFCDILGKMDVAGSIGMDEQSKIEENDLPEPIRPPLTPEKNLDRQWNLIVVFLTFVAGYAVLHKLVIPATLRFTPLRDSAYSQIDFWFLHPVVLALLLQRYRRNNTKISFLAGIAILYGIYEVYETAVGRNTGWFAFSRLLSATPLAVGCGYLMGQTKLGGNLKAGWAGVFVFTLIIGVNEYRSISRQQNPVVATNESAINRGVPVGEEPTCGAQELMFSPRQRAQVTRQIFVKDCGLTPASIMAIDGVLEVKNERNTAINLHFVVQESGRVKTKWNIVVPGGTLVTTKPIAIPTGGAGFIYSDSAPEVGLTGIFSEPVVKEWVLKRKPITLK